MPANKRAPGQDGATAAQSAIMTPKPSTVVHHRSQSAFLLFHPTPARVIVQSIEMTATSTATAAAILAAYIPPAHSQTVV
jgi:hypothetical protein